MRLIEITFCIILLIILLPLNILIILIIKIESKGPFIHWSKRVGKHNVLFLMPKFRTMKINTPDIASHLIKEPKNYLTKSGYFIRRFSIDEIPQLYSILKGQMTFVGPRPALHNQFDLINLRLKYGIEAIKPGITGWAQINGRDNITIEKKVEYDSFYFNNKNFFLDLKIILLTLIKVLYKKNVSH